MEARALMLVVTAAALTLGLFGACGGEVDDSVSFGARTQEATLDGGGFGSSSCAQCIDTTCKTTRSTCEAEPDCASTLTCIAQCGEGKDGDVERTCAKDCGKPTSTVGRAAFDAFDACGGDARRHACKVCNGGLAGYQSAVLRQDCRQAPPAPTTPACEAFDGGIPADMPCRGCLYAQCCDTVAECQVGSECRAINDCIAPCPGSDVAAKSYSRCFAEHPAGVQAFLDQLSCGVVQCGASCTNGGVSPCAQCVSDRCAEEVVAGNTPESFEYSDCTASCKDTACSDRCGAENEKGRADATVILACQLTRCTSECAL